MQNLSILIVDDEPTIRKTLSISLEAEGHQVMAISNSKAALFEADRRHFDLALIDLRLGTESGMELIAGLPLRAYDWPGNVRELRNAIDSFSMGRNRQLIHSERRGERSSPPPVSPDCHDQQDNKLPYRFSLPRFTNTPSLLSVTILCSSYLLMYPAEECAQRKAMIMRKGMLPLPDSRSGLR